ncbi:MAG: glutathione S-transferase [Pseudomonadota bacterium]
MIIVHHLEKSRSHRALWTLEELGLDYEVKLYRRDPETSLAPETLKTVHPLGKAPIVEVDGVVYAETAAIIETLIDRHGNGKLRPAPGSPAFDAYRFWLHYSEGSAMPPLLLALVLNKMETAKMPFFAKPIAKKIAGGVRDAFVGPQLALHFQFIEDALETDPWFTGADFSAADIMMSFPLQGFLSRAGKPADYPNIAAFCERIKARPAYKAAEERGGRLEALS